MLPEWCVLFFFFLLLGRWILPDSIDRRERERERKKGGAPKSNLNLRQTKAVVLIVPKFDFFSCFLEETSSNGTLFLPPPQRQLLSLLSLSQREI
jgi:hypothetical protein